MGPRRKAEITGCQVLAQSSGFPKDSTPLWNYGLPSARWERSSGSSERISRARPAIAARPQHLRGHFGNRRPRPGTCRRKQQGNVPGSDGRRRDLPKATCRSECFSRVMKSARRGVSRILQTLTGPTSQEMSSLLRLFWRPTLGNSEHRNRYEGQYRVSENLLRQMGLAVFPLVQLRPVTRHADLILMLEDPRPNCLRHSHSRFSGIAFEEPDR